MTNHREKKVVICLPTYNEAANIEDTINAVFAAVPGVFILIIDDNSPDGTGAIADRLSENSRQISVIHRPYKQGLGVAYHHGFEEAINILGADILVQMDADMSHHPEYLPEMLAAIEKADLVLGSRYVRGGGTENWGLVRRIISRFGSLYAKLILQIPLNDLTGGFKAWRRDLLDAVLKQPIASSGYSFQIEMTYHAYLMRAGIIEIPIVFTDRSIGKSKMSLATVFEAFWRVPFFRLRKSRRK